MGKQCGKCIKNNKDNVDLTNVLLPAVCATLCDKQTNNKKKEACQKTCYIKKETCGTECNETGGTENGVQKQCDTCIKDNMDGVNLASVSLPAVCTTLCKNQSNNKKKAACKKTCYVKKETCGTECNETGNNGTENGVQQLCDTCIKDNENGVNLASVVLPQVCTTFCSKENSNEKKKLCQKKCYVKKETCG